MRLWKASGGQGQILAGDESESRDLGCPLQMVMSWLEPGHI